MNSKKAFEKAIELQKKQIKRTEKLMEINQRLTDPNGNAMKKGLQVNRIFACGLILTGGIQVLCGYPLYALGSITAGTISIKSNEIYRYVKKKKC